MLTVTQKKKIVKEYLEKGNIKQISKKYDCTTSTIHKWVRKYATNGYTRVRTKLLEKHDKNEDGFISIEEFLTDFQKKSKGPKAKSKEINYGYQYLSNIYNFLYIYLRKEKLKKFVILPDYAISVRGGLINSSSCIDFHYENIYFPQVTVKAIRKGIKKKSCTIY